MTFVRFTRELEMAAPTPEALIAAFADDPSASFVRLSSHEQASRPLLDVLGVAAYEVCRFSGHEHPFTAVRDRLIKRATPRDPALPPFQGGALGTFAYESVRHVEPSLAKAGTMTLPGADATMIFHRAYVVIDHQAGRVVVIAGYFPDEETDGERTAKRVLDEVAERVAAAPPRSSTFTDNAEPAAARELRCRSWLRALHRRCAPAQGAHPCGRHLPGGALRPVHAGPQHRARHLLFGPSRVAALHRTKFTCRAIRGCWLGAAPRRWSALTTAFSRRTPSPVRARARATPTKIAA